MSRSTRGICSSEKPDFFPRIYSLFSDDGIFTSEKTDFFPRMESLFSGGGICSSEDPKNKLLPVIGKREALNSIKYSESS